MVLLYEIYIMFILYLYYIVTNGRVLTGYHLSMSEKGCHVLPL